MLLPRRRQQGKQPDNIVIDEAAMMDTIVRQTQEKERLRTFRRKFYVEPTRRSAKRRAADRKRAMRGRKANVRRRLGKKPH